jgi:hypothetical protein
LFGILDEFRARQGEFLKKYIFNNATVEIFSFVEKISYFKAIQPGVPKKPVWLFGVERGVSAELFQGNLTQNGAKFGKMTGE